jgi:hypothetical protein
VIEPRIIHGGISDVAPLRGDASEALPGSRSEHGDGQARTHGDTYATEVLNRWSSAPSTITSLDIVWAIV